jgi:DNA-binding PadR family transcriptional regulator
MAARFDRIASGVPLDIYPLRIDDEAMAKKDTAHAPLTPAVLHILLALSTQERHGYGIMKEVEADSHGKVRMGPGTLYGSIGRMIEAGLIRESDKTMDPEMDDERRVYYKLTGLGQKALAGELDRYREVVAVAKRKTFSPSRYAYGM